MLHRLAAIPTLPLTARFIRLVNQERPLAIFPRSGRQQASIGSFCTPAVVAKVQAGTLDEETTVIDLEHAGPAGELRGLVRRTSIGSTRVRLENVDLITTRLRPYLKKTVALDGEPVLVSPEWIPLNVDDERLRPGFLKLILLTDAYARLAALLSTGKQHPRIQEDALLRLQIPVLAIDEQDELLRQIEPILSRAISLAQESARMDRLVDPVFTEQLGLDLGEIEARSAPQVERLSLSTIADYPDARFSWKFHAPDVQRARDILVSRSAGPLGAFLSEPAVLGHSVTPESDYSDESDFTYVTMAALRDWRLDVTPCPKVTETYALDHQSRSLRVGDVLMARSGEGTIGKVAIVEEPLEGRFADFVIRLRTDESRLRPRFLRYALTSSYYQKLIYGEKKGLGNNTNVFPSQLHRLPWIDVDVGLQDRIIEELDAQAMHLRHAAQEAQSLFAKAEGLLLAALEAGPETPGGGNDTRL